jgi:hypothetical protein
VVTAPSLSAVHTLDTAELQEYAAQSAAGLRRAMPPGVARQVEKLITALESAQAIVRHRNDLIRDAYTTAEDRYVNALNAVNSATGHTPFLTSEHRGQMLAHRHHAEELRRGAGMAVPDYSSEEWRSSRGVYPPLMLARFRREHLASCAECRAAA